MYERIDIIREQLDLIEKNSIQQDAEEYKAKQEANRYKTILLEFLKSKIGQKIYWAHKHWKKYETHTIKDIGTGIQESEFFGGEYIGKECVRIYIEDGGYYIADNIGITLFFDESVAKAHTRQE